MRGLTLQALERWLRYLGERIDGPEKAAEALGVLDCLIVHYPPGADSSEPEEFRASFDATTGAADAYNRYIDVQTARRDLARRAPGGGPDGRDDDTDQLCEQIAADLKSFFPRLMPLAPTLDLDRVPVAIPEPLRAGTSTGSADRSAVAEPAAGPALTCPGLRVRFERIRRDDDLSEGDKRSTPAPLQHSYDNPDLSDPRRHPEEAIEQHKFSSLTEFLSQPMK
jgi:hypothetical protein